MIAAQGQGRFQTAAWVSWEQRQPWSQVGPLQVMGVPCAAVAPAAQTLLTLASQDAQLCHLNLQTRPHSAWPPLPCTAWGMSRQEAGQTIAHLMCFPLSGTLPCTASCLIQGRLTTSIHHSPKHILHMSSPISSACTQS